MIIKKTPEKFRGLFSLFIMGIAGKPYDILLILLIKELIGSLIKTLI